MELRFKIIKFSINHKKNLVYNGSLNNLGQNGLSEKTFVLFMYCKLFTEMISPAYRRIVRILFHHFAKIILI